MTDCKRALKHLLQSCGNDVSERDELTELAEIELVNLAQMLVLYLDEQAKASDHPMRYLRGLITLYGVTGARDQFRDAVKTCLIGAEEDGKKIYAIANQICSASSSGKLGTDEDYDFLESLFTEQFGADYFQKTVEHLAGSKVFFRTSGEDID